MPEKRNVLLVEGTSDFGLVRNLWKLHNPGDDPFEIEVKFGLNNLREAFSGFLLASDVARLGVIADADVGVEKRWPGFYQTLRTRGYARVPPKLPPDGLVLEEPDAGVCVVGVWLMPDNSAPGGLEEMVRRMVHSDDQLWLHADTVLNEIPGNLVKFKSTHRSKAHVHTWLAWQEEPGMRIGPAVTRGVLNANAPEALRLMEWLRQVFVSAGAEPPLTRPS